MNKKVLFVIILVIIILGFVFFSRNDTEKSDNNDIKGTGIEEANNNSSNNGSDEISNIVNINYTDLGYDPKTLSISVGQTVKFTNDSSVDVWTASDPHPIHTNFSEFDQKSAGGNGTTYQFTFNKAGSYQYHNHRNPNHKGVIIVQ
ncbi:MAG: cupredoxin domain-containing protein [bacterium]|nr:cupredoxin domain-containing protein [bacterium]